MKFIQDKFRVPDIAHDINASGKCYLKFVVGEDGVISSIKVQRGIPGCPECDKEVIRVLKMMPNWKPGKLKGKAVSSYFNLPINIDLQ
jgi:protein TonB